MVVAIGRQSFIRTLSKSSGIQLGFTQNEPRLNSFALRPVSKRELSIIESSKYHKTAASKSFDKMTSDPNKVRFDGRTAIVTGAGGGLGRSYALLLASHGASVIVNDLGGSRSGEGKSSAAADKVVQEIVDLGGKAVANYDSVEDGESIVQCAVKNFGRLDILINNAGILRDRSFARLSDSDWNLVHQVHMNGAYKMTKAAWPIMKQQGYGRIIMTSSGAGIYGNFGQANYSSAKLGLVGLSNTLAIEGGRSGIHCNVIVPVAASRLTEDILPPDIMNILKPEYIAPVVAWLCHEDCTENGSVIESAGGWAGKYRWQRSSGHVFESANNSKTTSLEKVRDDWTSVVDMNNPVCFEGLQEATSELVTTLNNNIEESQKKKQLEEKMSATTKDSSPTDAVGFTSEPFEFEYTFKELILYNLSVGADLGQNKDFGLSLLYENSHNFAPISSFGVIPAFGGLAILVADGVPGLSIDLARVLHGEQYTELLNPIPSGNLGPVRLSSKFQVSAVLDKGSGALIVVDVISKDVSTNQNILRNQLSIFVVGSGGFGGPRTSEKIILPENPPVNRKPDVVKEYQTSINQAALYRLNGDLNPLHIDPQFSALGGFDSPILHGLCTEGIAVRCVTEEFASNDPGKVIAVKARFAKPVFPGQTIITEMWNNGDKIHFQCIVKETKEPCLTGGWIKLARDASKL